MADLTELLEGCTASTPTDIVAYLQAQAKAKNFKIFLDDGDKNIFVPKSRLDEALENARVYKEELATQKKSLEKLSTLTADNEAANTEIGKLQTALGEKEASLTKSAVMNAFISKCTNEDFIAPLSDIFNLVDYDKFKVNKDGSVTGIEEAIIELKTTKPYLVKVPEQNLENNPPFGGTGNPGFPPSDKLKQKQFKPGEFGKSLGESVAKTMTDTLKNPYFKD